MRHVRIVVLGILLLAVAAASAHAAGPYYEPNGWRPDPGASAHAAGPWYEPNGWGPYVEPHGFGPIFEPNG